MKTKKKRGERGKCLTTKEKINKYGAGGKNKLNYVYSLNLNQKVVIENKWDIDLIDLAIFESIKKIYLHVFSDENKMDNVFVLPKKDEIGNWAFISESYISRNIPLLPLSSSDAIYKRIVKLELCCLIERHPLNRLNRTKYLRLGGNAKLFDFVKEVNE